MLPVVCYVCLFSLLSFLLLSVYLLILSDFSCRYYMPQQLGTTALLCQGPHLQQVLQVISQQFGYWLDSCICCGVIFVVDIHWPAHGEREEGEGEVGSADVGSPVPVESRRGAAA